MESGSGPGLIRFSRTLGASLAALGERTARRAAARSQPPRSPSSVGRVPVSHGRARGRPAFMGDARRWQRGRRTSGSRCDDPRDRGPSTGRGLSIATSASRGAGARDRLSHAEGSSAETPPRRLRDGTGTRPIRTRSRSGVRMRRWSRAQPPNRFGALGADPRSTANGTDRCRELATPARPALRRTPSSRRRSLSGRDRASPRYAAHDPRPHASRPGRLRRSRRDRACAGPGRADPRPHARRHRNAPGAASRPTGCPDVAGSTPGARWSGADSFRGGIPVPRAGPKGIRS